MTMKEVAPLTSRKPSAKPPGPRPLSATGYLPGKGWSKKRKTPFSVWLKLTRIRSEPPLTQEQFARLIGRSGTEVARWERGADFPPTQLIPVIAEVLGVDPDPIWTKAYLLPPDIQLFLTTTIEGDQVLRNIRRIMDRLRATQPPTMKPGIPPNPVPYESTGHLHEPSGERGDIREMEHSNFLFDVHMAHDPEAFSASGDPIDWEETIERAAIAMAGFSAEHNLDNNGWTSLPAERRKEIRQQARIAVHTAWDWEHHQRTQGRKRRANRKH